MDDEPNVAEAAELTYSVYLKIPELLDLQQPRSQPPHHDEMLFLVIHQTYELWFKLILHELETAIDNMKEAKVLRARHFVERVVIIMKLLVDQIHILETMTPAEFTQFRYRLKPASGFQSAQFREIEFVCGLKNTRYLGFFKNDPEMIKRLKRRLGEPDLREIYYGMLLKLGFALPTDQSVAEFLADEARYDEVIKVLVPIYQTPENNLPLYLLTESLVSLDQVLALWREHHIRVVERIIGFKRGTGGSSGVAYLQTTLGKKCFPMLWDIRTLLDEHNA
jgi:tryptophan 2,3-dioxygenase